MPPSLPQTPLICPASWLPPQGPEKPIRHPSWCGTVLRHGNLVTSAGRSTYECWTGNGILTGSTIQTGNCNTGRNLWGRFEAARPTTDIASQYITADKPEITSSCTSQEVTTSLPILHTQTLPVHTYSVQYCYGILTGLCPPVCPFVSMVNACVLSKPQWVSSDVFRFLVVTSYYSSPMSVSKFQWIPMDWPSFQIRRDFCMKLLKVNEG